MVYGKSKHNFQRFNEFAARGTGWGKGKEGREREALNLSSASPAPRTVTGFQRRRKLVSQRDRISVFM